MSKCPGLHCPGCSSGETAGAVASAVAIAVAVWLLAQILWLLAAAVGVAVAVSVPALIWLARRGPAIAAGGADAPQRWAAAVAAEKMQVTRGTSPPRCRVIRGEVITGRNDHVQEQVTRRPPLQR